MTENVALQCSWCWESPYHCWRKGHQTLTETDTTVPLQCVRLIQKEHYVWNPPQTLYPVFSLWTYCAHIDLLWVDIQGVITENPQMLHLLLPVRGKEVLTGSMIISFGKEDTLADSPCFIDNVISLVSRIYLLKVGLDSYLQLAQMYFKWLCVSNANLQ